MSIRSYVMARFYDIFMKEMESTCLSVWRSDLLSEICGDVLEVGSGTGVNLSYYPKSISSLVKLYLLLLIQGLLLKNVIELSISKMELLIRRRYYEWKILSFLHD